MQKQNTQSGFIPLIAIAIIAVVAIGGGVAVYNKTHTEVEVKDEMDTSMEDDSMMKDDAMVSGDIDGKISIKGLLSLGKSQKCTFQSSTDNSSSSGVVYVADGKMRGDFESKTSATTVKSHMIANKTDVNIWTDSMSQGFKTKTSIMTDGEKPQGTVDIDQKLDYKCTPWTADASVFTPPANITFTDTSEMMVPTIPANIKSKIDVNTSL